MAFKLGMAVDLLEAYLFMLVSMTLTLMQGIVDRQSQKIIILFKLSRQVSRQQALNFATTVGLFFFRRDLHFTRKRLYGLTGHLILG